MLAEWCAGRAKISEGHKSTMSKLLERLEELIVSAAWLPRTLVSDWVQWRPREQNKEADELANLAMDHR
eukprot:11346606-Karenia_brevis.AAC.1